MRFWLICFTLLFGMEELLRWFKQFSLPLPVFILGGLFLAIASNYDKLKSLPFHPDHDEYGEFEEKPYSKDFVEPTTATWVEVKPATPASNFQSSRPISFTIRRPDQST